MKTDLNALSPQQEKAVKELLQHEGMEQMKNIVAGWKDALTVDACSELDVPAHETKNDAAALSKIKAARRYQIFLDVLREFRDTPQKWGKITITPSPP